jgi:hypothetical protein
MKLALCIALFKILLVTGSLWEGSQQLQLHAIGATEQELLKLKVLVSLDPY